MEAILGVLKGADEPDGRTAGAGLGSARLGALEVRGVARREVIVPELQQTQVLARALGLDPERGGLARGDDRASRMEPAAAGDAGGVRRLSGQDRTVDAAGLGNHVAASAFV